MEYNHINKDSTLKVEWELKFDVKSLKSFIRSAAEASGDKKTKMCCHI